MILQAAFQSTPQLTDQESQKSVLIGLKDRVEEKWGKTNQERKFTHPFKPSDQFLPFHIPSLKRK